MLHRVRKLSVAFEQRAQVTVSLGITGAALERLAKSRLRLAKALPADEEDAIVVVALRQVRIDGDRRTILGLGALRLSGSSVQGDQVGMRLDQFGILPDGLFVFRDRVP